MTMKFIKSIKQVQRSIKKKIEVIIKKANFSYEDPQNLNFLNDLTDGGLSVNIA